MMYLIRHQLPEWMLGQKNSSMWGIKLYVRIFEFQDRYYCWHQTAMINTYSCVPLFLWPLDIQEMELCYLWMPHCWDIWLLCKQYRYGSLIRHKRSQVLVLRVIEYIPALSHFYFPWYRVTFARTSWIKHRCLWGMQQNTWIFMSQILI